MLIRRLALTLLACSLVSPLLAAEKGQIGLALNADSASRFGALWHISKHLALEPRVGFSVRSENNLYFSGEYGPYERTDYDLLGSLGLRYYLAPGQTLSPYLRTGLSYSRTLRSVGNDSNTISWTVAAAGLQYSPSKRFSVFGDLGLSASRWSQGHDRVWTAGTFTSSIGAVLYFN
jgi:hypothetical protein